MGFGTWFRLRERWKWFNTLIDRIKHHLIPINNHWLDEPSQNLDYVMLITFSYIYNSLGRIHLSDWSTPRSTIGWWINYVQTIVRQSQHYSIHLVHHFLVFSCHLCVNQKMLSQILTPRCPTMMGPRLSRSAYKHP